MKPPARSPQKKRPFIVREIDSRMLRKHPELSKGARMLWLTMLTMANAKTGELRHREHWYCAREIDRRAEISKRTRLQQMKELLRVGLVRMERERTEGVLTDRRTGRKRLRAGVLGEVRYFVFKSPHKDWFSHTAETKSPREHCGSSTVQSSKPIESRNTPNKTECQYEKSPHKQRVSTTVQFYVGGKTAPTSTSVLHPQGSVGVSGSSLGGSSLNGSSSVSGKAPANKTDDDSSSVSPDVPESAGARQRRLKDSAFPKIKSEFGGLYSDDQIHAGLEKIEAQAKGPPVSDNFYVTAFRNNATSERNGGNSNGKRKRFGAAGLSVDEQLDRVRQTAETLRRTPR